MTPPPLDWLITGTTLVTMDAGRRIVMNGYLGIRGDCIAAIGKQADLDPQLADAARRTIDGRRFVVTPGYVNAHIHTTCEPLVRGFVPDDLTFDDNVFGWMVPLYTAQTPEDEHLAAQIAACELLRSGTTCFLEAGTAMALDAVIAAHAETGTTR